LTQDKIYDTIINQRGKSRLEEQMDLTVFIRAQDILAFRDGQFVVLQDGPQHGVPVTGPIDEFEISDFIANDPDTNLVRWRSAGGVRKPSPFPTGRS
jgi:hypothetical protein